VAPCKKACSKIQGGGCDVGNVMAKFLMIGYLLLVSPELKPNSPELSLLKHLLLNCYYSHFLAAILDFTTL